MLQPLLLCFHLVQGSRFRALVAASPPFLEDGILVSQPSPLGNAIKLRKSLTTPPSGEVPKAIGACQRLSNNVGYTVVLPPHLTSLEMASHWIFASLHS